MRILGVAFSVGNGTMNATAITLGGERKKRRASADLQLSGRDQEHMQLGLCSPRRRAHLALHEPLEVWQAFPPEGVFPKD